MNRIVLAVIWLTAAGVAHAEPRIQTASVDGICAAARKRADASPEKARIFATVATETRTNRGTAWEAGPWQEFADRAALESVAQTGTVFEQAFVWDLPGNSLVVTLFMTSPSGDWGHFVDYCYRADGTLASAESTLNTFYAPDGGVRRIRSRRFDRAGHLLWVHTRVLDLRTKKARPHAEFMDQEEPIFQTRASLPFGSLLVGPG